MPHIYSHPVGDQEREAAGPEGSRTGKTNVKKTFTKTDERALGRRQGQVFKGFFHKAQIATCYTVSVF